MDEEDVRSSAQAVGDALVAGDVDAVIAHLSEELRHNLGEVVALLPLPATESTVQSIERGSAAFIVVLRVLGETSEVELQTRWKDRNGTPRIVEISHLSRTGRDVGTEEGSAVEGEPPGED